MLALTCLYSPGPVDAFTDAWRHTCSPWRSMSRNSMPAAYDTPNANPGASPCGPRHGTRLGLLTAVGCVMALAVWIQTTPAAPCVQTASAWTRPAAPDASTSLP